MRSDFHIEFQPQLLEEAILRAIVHHPEADEFWQERERLYETSERDNCETAFQTLHAKWFHRLGLANPLRQILALWPILTEATSRCLLLKARSQKNLGAELYLSPESSGSNARERRTIVVQLTPELLAQSEAFLQFLRHEFLHVVDMLDPHFGYEPNFPKSDAGPAYDHFLQGRYGVLWDITVDGRLFQRGWLPPSVREKHFTNFKRAFQGAEDKLAKTFAHFFDQNSHTHRELVEFAQHPEKWLAGEAVETSSKGRCAICHFPTFQLIAPGVLDVEVIAKIREHYPDWNTAQLICRQCADLYEARVL
ncbi:MAG: hypothetical protein ONB48_16450 [candidate division KSB1 bacterium]|nr:hypothetical protein [candidate division KSB1 bacterium]MDZ7274237.1 hypothetical protein [candidate division KSB1 bacterium]MDZ7287241.1 hypothetical protein [candidate division KSB1 bacterium]MDZ7296835.1 hypothetical protein [candidate division KSB1 bacterium]MDZ7347701.1 hypothetical protein [candidate division KSB1 bacterium]